MNALDYRGYSLWFDAYDSRRHVDCESALKLHADRIIDARKAFVDQRAEVSRIAAWNDALQAI